MKSQILSYLAGLLSGALILHLSSSNTEETNDYDHPVEKIEILNPKTLESKAVIPQAHSEERIDSLQLEIATLKTKLSKYESGERYDAERLQSQKEKYIASSLKQYRALFELTEEQGHLIGEIEWETNRYWHDVQQGKINVKEIPFQDPTVEIKKLLTPEQLEIYTVHLENQKTNIAELATTATLNRFPITLELNDDQKDEIYQNLFMTFHADTSQSFDEKWKNTPNPEFDRGSQRLVWAAEGILTEEQLNKFKSTLKKAE